MTKILLFIGVLISSIVFSQEKIFWTDDYKLKWEDFEAQPSIRHVAALSYCGIQLYSCKGSTRRNTTYRIRAYFEPKNSWSWKNYQRKYVLDHEQLHFDIAEIYARKIRQYFDTHSIKMENSIAEYQKIYADYVIIQDLYDEETHHGTRDSKQKIWEEKIKSELLALDAYKVDECY